MRSVFQICLVTGVQIIASFNAGWGIAEALFIGSFFLIWQVLFTLIMLKILSKRGGEIDVEYSNFVWFLIFPVAAIISPVFAIIVFLLGTILDLNKTSGGISLKCWFKNQIAHDQSNSFNNYVEVKFPDEGYNPATGYPLHGGIDSAGNPNGSNWYER
ncbi:TPA: hypothetical protein ACQFA5_003185 [Escherichia coli]